MYLTHHNDRRKCGSSAAEALDDDVGRFLTRLDFPFNRIEVQCVSTAGAKYSRTIGVGMPAIPEVILKSVVYLFEDLESAQEGKADNGACGFLVGIRSAKKRSLRHVYVVANYHVAKQSATGKVVLRLNKQRGGADYMEFDVDDWEHIPGGGDVAAIEVRLDDKIHSYNPTGVENFLTADLARDKVAVGEDVFMVGRFVDHDGGIVNKPAARFGNISMQPSPHRDMENSKKSLGYYCLDMHSRGGFSGSPVYVYRTVGSDLSDAMSGTMPQLHAPFLGLLGIHCGQFKEQLETDDGTMVTGWSGMTSILPAWHIQALLNCDKFKNERAATEAAWKEPSGPVPERAKSTKIEERNDDAFNLTVRKMLATPPIKPRGKKSKA